MEARTAPVATPAVSVVVPTRNRLESLGRCLDALGRQNSAARLEVVVVDDGSRDGGAIEVLASRAGARYARLEGRGPAAARNAGVRIAGADVICFTDDDCEPDPEWAERLVTSIAGEAAAAAGHTVIAGRPDSLTRATQLIVDHLVESSRTSPELVGFAPSCNLACRVDVLSEIPFDERYPSYGEDRDWCARLHAAGYSLRWVSGAVVRHHQRLDIARFVHKHGKYGAGAYRFRHTNLSERRLEPREFYTGLLRRAAGGGAATAAAVCLAQAATAVGFAAAGVASGRSQLR